MQIIARDMIYFIKNKMKSQEKERKVIKTITGRVLEEAVVLEARGVAILKSRSDWFA